MPRQELGKLLALPSTLRRFLISQDAFSVTARTTKRYSTPPVASDVRRSYATEHAPSAQHATSGSSVNSTEVSHFNALASSWWDPHGSSRLLHLMNPLRHRFIRRCQATDPLHQRDKLKYLDIGCGGGIFAESAARLHDTNSVTGVDPTPEVIAVAKRHQRHDPLLLEAGRLEYKNIPIEELPLPATPAEGYDVVSLFEVVEHIQNPAPFLQSCLKQLKPGGWLVGSTIARTNTSWITTKLFAEDILRIVPRGTHDWSQYIQPHELKSRARKQPGLEIEGDGWQVMGVVYVPGLGWKEVSGSEEWGNYFFGVRKGSIEE